LANNQAFFSTLADRLDLTTAQGAGYALTIYAVIITIIALFLFIAGQKFLLKPLAIFLLLLAAVLSYFTQELGVIFNVDMVRNTVETIKDNNQQEATELLSFPLIKHVFLYGVLPVLVVLWVKVSYKALFKEQLTRVGYVLGLVAIVTSLIMLNFKYTTFFSRENRDLRVYITPLYAIDSVKGFVRSERKKEKMPLQVVGEDAVQVKPGKERIIGVMVVGETARADHFSLNGYSRETNPKLKKEAIINYPQVSSCGTSTAFSVPCMFSFYDRSDYSPAKAASQTNTLDVLEKAGVEVIWLDNNSSCKGVCARTGEINLRGNPDKSSQYYSDGEEFDEALIVKMDEQLKTLKTDKDVLFVLHTLGSHGPKYYKRYPASFSKFEPACKKATPQECTDEEIINAYDNTILYTDHVLSQLIDYLKKQQNNTASFLIYASDHGESLGENGVYLHGLPYFLAPEAQTRVPMFAWFSKNYIDNNLLDLDTMKNKAKQALSHDNLSHSLLGAYGVSSRIYQQKYDLLNKHKHASQDDGCASKNVRC
jgi:lipid A ethanolaminephosphotransferase